MTFHPHTSDAGRFTVEFPWGPPEVRRRTEPSPWGPVTDEAAEVRAGANSCAVVFADFTGGGLDRVDLNRVIAAGRDAVARAVGGWADPGRAVTVDGRGGTDVVVRGGRPGQGPVYLRYVPDGRRLYTLTVLCDRGTVPEPVKDWFFGSFTLTR